MQHSLTLLAASRRTEDSARAELNRPPWFKLRVTQDYRGGWRCDVIAGPGANAPFVHHWGASGFATHADAEAAGNKRMALCRRGQEINEAPFSVIGGKP